jgi:choline kinase
MQLDYVLWTPAWKDINAVTVHSVLKCTYLSKYKFVWQLFTGDALISRARSVSLTLFLKDYVGIAPYVVFLDSDIVFQPEHMDRLIGRLQEGYDLIGGLYVVRDGTQPASYAWGGRVQIDQKVHEVEYLSTGFMGISRKLLDKMVKKLKLPMLNEGEFCQCYPFFEATRRFRKKGKPIYISEDWDFCEKARQVGVKAYLDTGIQVGHAGQKIWTTQDLLTTGKWEKNEAAAPKEAAEKEIDEPASQSL